jgi:hypothetical protein
MAALSTDYRITTWTPKVGATRDEAAECLRQLGTVTIILSTGQRAMLTTDEDDQEYVLVRVDGEMLPHSDTEAFYPDCSSAIDAVLALLP